MRFALFYEKSRLGYAPVALPSTAYRPGKVVSVLQVDPFQADTVCEYGSYIGTPSAAKDVGASIQASQKLAGLFSLSADYLKQIKADTTYQYVRDITVTLSNIFVEEIADNQIYDGRSAQQLGCTQAIRHAQNRSQLGFLKHALRADAVYKVTFDQKASLTAEARQELLQGLAFKLGASHQSVTNNQISGDNLYWGVRQPRPDLVFERQEPPRTLIKCLRSGLQRVDKSGLSVL